MCSVSLKPLNINDGMNNSPKGQVVLGRQSPYSKYPLFLFLHSLYGEHDVIWSGISLWSSPSSLRYAARFRCKATANYAGRNLYPPYMYPINKLFSTP